MATQVLPPPGTCREGAAAGCPTTSTRRRDFLGAAGFTALAGISAAAIAKPDRPASASLAPAGDDAELIAIGREAADLIEQRKPLEARWWALPRLGKPRTKGELGHDEMDAVSAAMNPIDDRLETLIDRAIVLHATCREAVAAKARLLRHDMAIIHTTSGEIDFESMDPPERMAWSLLHDLLAVQS